jgi:hypothetical protein
MVVALVAAPGNPLPLANAVPMIMGANIGTTVAGRPESYTGVMSTTGRHPAYRPLPQVRGDR